MFTQGKRKLGHGRVRQLLSHEAVTGNKAKAHHWRAERPANTGERPAVWVMTQQKQEQTTEKHNERHIVQNVRLRKRSRHKRVHIV